MSLRLSRPFFVRRRRAYTLHCMNRALPIFWLCLSALPAHATSADESAVLQLLRNHPDADDIEQKRDQLQINFANAPEPRWQWQFQHDYRVFSLATIDGQEADSNGHVHQLSLALHFADKHWRGRLQPLIATSSNALRERKLDSADLRWQGELYAIAAESVAGEWQIGLRVDDSFGHYRAYSSVAWQHRLRNGAQLRLGWPDSSIRFPLADAWALHGDLKPTGGQWHVYDPTFEHDSTLRYRQWQFGWQLHWQVSDGWQIALGVAREFDQRLRYQLVDGRIIVQRGADQNAAQFLLQRRF
jgi:hypothetical protein